QFRRPFRHGPYRRRGANRAVGTACSGPCARYPGAGGCNAVHRVQGFGRRGWHQSDCGGSPAGKLQDLDHSPHVRDHRVARAQGGRRGEPGSGPPGQVRREICFAAPTLPPMKHEHDVVSIGGGSGGYAAARTTGAAGLDTVVSEGGEEVGGLCILRGCMPTKALLYAAEVLHLAGHAGTWGIRAENVGFDFAAVMARKKALIKDFADCRQQQLISGKFKFLRATAHFRDPHLLELSNGDRVAGKHFVIATGSILAPSPLPQLAQLECLNSDSALKLERLPRSIIVLGGGAVAVEF